MWEKLGLTIFDVERMPWQMVEDIETMMQAEAKEEEAKLKRQQSKRQR